MDDPRRALTVVRVGLAAFVVLWLFGPYALRAAIPMWLPFAIALGLELHFFLAPRRTARPDRLPQEVDRERYGYSREPDDLLLVREGDEELWIPYRGEPPEEVEDLVAAAREDVAEAAPAPADAGRAPRSIRQLALGIGVVASLAVLFWLVDSRSGWNGLAGDTRREAAARFSAEAGRIAGKRVTIRCDESGDFVGAVQHADGVASVGGGLAYLTPERCYDLYRLAFRDEVTFSQTARSIAVLAHEAWHLRGVRDEGTTECYALQSGVDLGRRLGLSERTARRMMRQQLVENSLRGASSTEYLITASCRDGGALDLKPSSSEFP